MDIFASFGTDPSLELKGKEVQIGADLWITVARSGGHMYNKILSEGYEQSKYVLKQKDAEAERRSEELMVDVTSRTVLLGWRGKMMYKGEALEFSQANAKLVLGVKDFRLFVSKLADDFENFKIVQDAETAKNSSPTSSGLSLGVVS